MYQYVRDICIPFQILNFSPGNYSSCMYINKTVAWPGVWESWDWWVHLGHYHYNVRIQSFTDPKMGSHKSAICKLIWSQSQTYWAEYEWFMICQPFLMWSSEKLCYVRLHMLNFVVTVVSCPDCRLFSIRLHPHSLPL